MSARPSYPDSTRPPPSQCLKLPANRTRVADTLTLIRMLPDPDLEGFRERQRQVLKMSEDSLFPWRNRRRHMRSYSKRAERSERLKELFHIKERLAQQEEDFLASYDPPVLARFGVIEYATTLRQFKSFKDYLLAPQLCGCQNCTDEWWEQEDIKHGLKRGPAPSESPTVTPSRAGSPTFPQAPNYNANNAWSLSPTRTESRFTEFLAQINQETAPLQFPIRDSPKGQHRRPKSHGMEDGPETSQVSDFNADTAAGPYETLNDRLFAECMALLTGETAPLRFPQRDRTENGIAGPFPRDPQVRAASNATETATLRIPEREGADGNVARPESHDEPANVANEPRVRNMFTNRRIWTTIGMTMLIIATTVALAMLWKPVITAIKQGLIGNSSPLIAGSSLAADANAAAVQCTDVAVYAPGCTDVAIWVDPKEQQELIREEVLQWIEYMHRHDPKLWDRFEAWKATSTLYKLYKLVQEAEKPDLSRITSVLEEEVYKVGRILTAVGTQLFWA